MAELIEMPFRVWSPVGLGKHVLNGGVIGATWRIRLNRPCVLAMQPCCLTLTTYLTRHRASTSTRWHFAYGAMLS